MAVSATASSEARDSPALERIARVPALAIDGHTVLTENTAVLQYVAERFPEAPWPALAAYYQRMLQRPSIARACGEKLTLYKEEQARHAS